MNFMGENDSYGFYQVPGLFNIFMRPIARLCPWASSETQVQAQVSLKEKPDQNEKVLNQFRKAIDALVEETSSRDFGREKSYRSMARIRRRFPDLEGMQESFYRKRTRKSKLDHNEQVEKIWEEHYPKLNTRSDDYTRIFKEMNGMRKHAMIKEDQSKTVARINESGSHFKNMIYGDPPKPETGFYHQHMPNVSVMECF